MESIGSATRNHPNKKNNNNTNDDDDGQAMKSKSHEAAERAMRQGSRIEYIDNSPVPVIDFGPFMDPSASHEDRQRVVEAVKEACEKIGFMVLFNHGVNQEVMERCWQKTREFFDMPVEEKAKWKSPNEEEYPFGYVGYGEETLSYGKEQEESRGEGESQTKSGEPKVSAPDLKENFSMGPYNPASGLPAPRLPEDKPEGFKQAWMDYYKEMEKVSAKLLQTFAEALDLPSNWFEDKIDKHRCALRALNYPDLDKPPLEGQLRASAHTDYGTLTILLPDDAPGGLQVKARGDDRWLPVPHVPGAFVINLGDLMRRWTNDKWESTLHRVVPPPEDAEGSTRRQSIAFFHNINADYVVECIPTCTNSENPPKYNPITAHDHLMQKHLASLEYTKFTSGTV